MKPTSHQKGSFAPPKNQFGPILKLLEGFNIGIARYRCNALSRAIANKLMAASNPNTFLSVPLQKKRVSEMQQFLSGQVMNKALNEQPAYRGNSLCTRKVRRDHARKRNA